MLADLLLILQSRMAVIFQRLENKGEAYKDEIITYNEALVANIPTLRRLKYSNHPLSGESCPLRLNPRNAVNVNFVFQDEQISTLTIDDRQVEALIIGIQQALKQSAIRTGSVFKFKYGFLMCYTVDLTTQPNIDYQQYPQEEWKLNLFSHYLGVLYCCETDEGKKIVSGAVVKTSAPHLSEMENNVVDADYREKPQA